MADEQEKSISPGWEAGRPTSGSPSGRVQACFQAPKWLSPHRRREEALWGLFCKGMNPIHEGFPIMIPKAPPSKSTTSGIRLSVEEFGGAAGRPDSSYSSSSMPCHRRQTMLHKMGWEGRGGEQASATTDTTMKSPEKMKKLTLSQCISVGKGNMALPGSVKESASKRTCT